MQMINYYCGRIDTKDRQRREKESKERKEGYTLTLMRKVSNSCSRDSFTLIRESNDISFF
jgi:hypothetical protein